MTLYAKVFFVLSVVFFSLASNAQKTGSIQKKDRFPPSIILTEGESITSKLLKRIMTRNYRDLDVEVVPFNLSLNRRLLEANEGKAGGVVGTAPLTPGKYKNLVQVPTPIIRVPVMIFAKQPFLVNGWESLKDKVVAAPGGANYFIPPAEMHLTVYFVTKQEAAFRMLAAGRVDIAVVSELTGLDVLKKEKEANYNTPAWDSWKDIEMLHTPLYIVPFHHYLHTDNVETFYSAINNVLAKHHALNQAEYDKEVTKLKIAYKRFQVRTEKK
jgi:hypothetical protein